VESGTGFTVFAVAIWGGIRVLLLIGINNDLKKRGDLAKGLSFLMSS
jgi:hypothetical protein